MLKLCGRGGGDMKENVEERVARQFSALYLTLVSVLVGLVLSDLFSTIHERMTLWPLTLQTVRTWCQILGITVVVLSSWITYTHLGMLRHRVPTLWDTLDAVLVLVTVPLNAATGRSDATAWFFWAAAFSALGSAAVNINLWQTAREPALRHFRRLARLGGPYTMLYGGPPLYLAMALAAHLGLAPLPLEIAATVLGPISGAVVAVLFMREWRAAVQQAAPKPPSRAR